VSRSDQGFTFLEVMVALAILATAFAAVLKLHADSVGMLLASRMHTSAAQLAQYKMTQVEVIGVENLPFLSGEFDDLAPDYEWKVEVEPTGMKDWRKITVTVSNRLVRKGGEYQLTEFMPSLKQEQAPFRTPTTVPPGQKSVPLRRGG
jgi:general secretion pathway protein I